MSNLHSSASPKRWQKIKKHSSFSNCFAVLIFIISFQTISVFQDFRHDADSNRLRIWVQSFTTSSSSIQQNCSFRRQRDPVRHDASDAMTAKLLPGVLPLHASGGNGDESDPTKSLATTTVYSVFSKSPSKVFRELTKGSGVLRLDDIYSLADDECRWDELEEIIQDGDLSEKEMETLYNAAMSSDGEGLDLEGFKKFYKSIDELFDDDDEDDDDDGSFEEPETENTADNTDIKPEESNANQDLVSYIEEVQRLESDSEGVQIGKRRPWGLDCTDKEREKISELIDLVTKDDNSNILTGRSNNNGLPMSAKDLVKYLLGTWDLKYTSSRTMIINKSLSGLGRSTSEMARNLGLQMKLSGNYYFGEAEFVETFGSGEDKEDMGDAVKLEAIVMGEWLLETGTRMDYKTGRPSVSLRVEVETIAYGPNKSPAEQWDSLSPIKLVDILYLDENLLVLRGNFNVDAIFVYTRR